jgi:thiamine transport system substrate-binding protein
MYLQRALVASVVLAATCSMAACSTTGDNGPTADETNGQIKDVVLVTHDSFALPKGLVKQFEQDTGYHLVVHQNGDAGELTNKLVLTTSSPLGDVAFGVDNTFASRALDNNVFESYDGTLPAGVDAHRLEGSDQVVPIDTASVCVNVDVAWYAAHHQAPPSTLDDLTDPAYQDQLVVEGAPTSSTGFAFLLATIAAEGEGWQDYWSRLMANGTKIDAGWEDAYYVDFTGGGGEVATRPIVVSYDSSPAFTIDKATGKSTTKALLDTCFRQTEYAGVLAGAHNPDGAKAFIDFLLSPQVQAALPTSMYVFPVVDGTSLPTEWAKWAVQPTTPFDVSAADIDANRDEWLNDWTDVTTK